MSASREAENAGEPGSAVKMEGGTTVQSSASEARSPNVERQLPEPAGYVAPSSPAEEVLATLWAGLLQVEKVGVHDNFFAIGGDSILCLQAVALASRAGIRVTAGQLFKHQTIAGLTAAIAEQAPASETASEIREPRAEYLTDDEPGSTARDEIGTSDLHVATEASINQIDGHLRTLQTGLSRIESKFETLVT